jgi:hypothetical protein
MNYHPRQTGKLPDKAYYEEAGEESAIEHSGAAVSLIEGLVEACADSRRTSRACSGKPVDTDAKVA